MSELSIFDKPDRKVTYYSPYDKCNRGLRPGWFRFQGVAGPRMPTSCPPESRCNTDATGWLNPTMADRGVCLHLSSNCCLWSGNIQVRNCGHFFLYYLSPPSLGCDLRYCSTD